MVIYYFLIHILYSFWMPPHFILYSLSQLEHPIGKASSITANGTVKAPKKYSYSFWTDLPPDIQGAFKLGYNKTGWYQAILPKSALLYWDELYPKMQEPAVLIGFTQQSWDGTLAIIFLSLVHIRRAPCRQTSRNLQGCHACQNRGWMDRGKLQLGGGAATSTFAKQSTN